MNLNLLIAEEIGVREEQVKAAVELLDEGCTVPFIARYRKERTGSLDDSQLRKLEERLNYLRGLEERREAVMKSIEEQGKLTPELQKQLLACTTLVSLEDLYRPYKQKRRTRAMIARERGLEPLAIMLFSQKSENTPQQEAQNYIGCAPEITSAEDALSGASDIIAEQIADSAAFRTWIRNRTRAYGLVISKAKKTETQSVYENYYDFSSPLEKMTGYRVLALNRGEKEKILSVSIEAPEEDILRYLSRSVIRTRQRELFAFLENALTDAYRRLMAPSIETELRNELTENAETGALEVFGKNLTQLLMQAPIAGETVLGWDPAFRTGCKLAVVDPTGKVLDTAVIFPTAPTNEQKLQKARETLRRMISKYHVSVISVGNGTASRESEQFITEFLKDIPEKVAYVITNEAGASVYSASELAAEEFPDFDVAQRSAVSIARRLQDPLAELVKIEPKAIGVGQYQHDMNQKRLGETLGGVVEDCVNRVGVDLNTASVPLLTNVSGISKAVAKNIVTYRETNGRFTNRRQLLKVSKLGPKAFEQCAGFMRIRGGDNPLDSTAVHPESYHAAEQLLEKLHLSTEDMLQGPSAIYIKDYAVLAQELGVGEPTLRDIVEELSKPGRDPREDMPRPVLRTDVLAMEDLKEGMILKGTVRNIVDFGAFVDIGVHQDGLVHISQMSSRKFVKHPLDVVSVGDIVEVKVLSVDIAKKRIGLSMKVSK